MEILYLTYDGLSEPLGQSQILPYINKLNKKHNFRIISFEKSFFLSKNRDNIKNKMVNNEITWISEKYHKFPKVFSTLWDLRIMYKRALQIYKLKPYLIVHCRSHLTAIVGLKLKKRLGIKLLFDMRSFYPDERVDGGIWPQTKPIYRLIFNYFKKKEIDLLNNCDALVVLTTKAKTIVQNFKNVHINSNKIYLIPCCADLNHFNKKKVFKKSQNELRSKLNINNDRFVVSYLGSIGTWYMTNEMFQFFKVVKSSNPNSIFLFITPNMPEEIIKIAKKNGVSPKDIRCLFGERSQLPSILSLSDVSLFFILPTFSKKASSPTKHAELMGLGIPVICNSGVGDLDEIINQTKTGYILPELNEKEYVKCSLLLNKIKNIDKKLIRSSAENLFSLDSGVKFYDNIYQSI